MGEYVASRVVKAMLQKELPLRGGKVLLLGLTFKENCPDVRNTRVIDVYNELKSYGLEVDVHDPWVDQTIADAEFGIKLLSEPEVGAYDAVVIAVAHQQFKAMGYSRIEQLCKPKSLIFDVKYVLPVDTSDERL
jgi:UDP-N-acetyl-D-galactosamine dehydrogenase